MNYYLFGSDAVKEFHNGEVITSDGTTYLHPDNGTPDDLLEAYDGWGGYANLTEKEYYDLFLHFHTFPEDYWDYITEHYPDYEGSSEITFNDRINVLLDGSGELSQSDTNWIKNRVGSLEPDKLNEYLDKHNRYLFVEALKNADRKQYNL